MLPVGLEHCVLSHSTLLHSVLQCLMEGIIYVYPFTYFLINAQKWLAFIFSLVISSLMSIESVLTKIVNC